jgi:1,4-alpha-glucan branching enzyme
MLLDILYDPSELEKMINAIHWDPHALLGLHTTQHKGVSYWLIRLYRPQASEVFIEVNGQLHALKPVDPRGLFVWFSEKPISALDYRVYNDKGKLHYDPYAFDPVWGSWDSHLFAAGCHYKLFEKMGARQIRHQGALGVNFCVWAPNARSVSVVCDSNLWDGRKWPMRSTGSSGVWELFVPGLESGEKYKFEIFTPEGDHRIKSDPYSLYNELRPYTASIVAEVDHFPWTDDLWMQKRSQGCDSKGYQEENYSKPILIYELHVGSWKRNAAGYPLNFRELAHELVRYCDEMGYTHVELMPIMEHPFDASWGYQVTGYFAVSSRWGNPSDFQYFVNYLHNHGLGVILDWVPAHFPHDAHALSFFDSTALYEHADPKKGYHPHWHTHIFNFGRHEVSNFLLASALFWCQKYHIDGLRVDAVASMIYLDYGREEGQWIPNKYGAKENLEAIEFLKHMNSILHQQCPGILTFAEESTSFTGITHPLEQGGLGFDFKWNMGWMNDTLRYMAKDPIWRKWHQDDLTFALVYAFSENFTLVLSHDEVVHGKGSLLSKMPGDLWQKCASLRLLYTYMLCMPGKKLLFMGQDIGQFDEWNFDRALPWHLLEYHHHRGIQTCVKEANALYKEQEALWCFDTKGKGFEWVSFDDKDNGVLAYLRKSSDGKLLCIHNFTPSYYASYDLFVAQALELREIFNSDEVRYGGSGKTNPKPIQRTQSGKFSLQLAPLATMIFLIEDI